MIEDKDVAINFRYWTIDNQNINIHNQYQLLTDNYGPSRPNKDIERKWFDSLIGFDISNQKGIDKLMIDLDGTNNKSKLGANAILGVSLACAKAASVVHNKELYEYIGGNNACTLPVPMINIINGGSHSDAPIAFQEFMIMPVGAKTFTHSLKIASEIFHNLKSILLNVFYMKKIYEHPIDNLL